MNAKWIDDQEKNRVYGEKCQRILFENEIRTHERSLEEKGRKHHFSKKILNLLLSFEVPLENISKLMHSIHNGGKLKWRCLHCGTANDSNEASFVQCEFCHASFQAQTVNFFPDSEAKPSFKRWLCAKCKSWNYSLIAGQLQECCECGHENDLEKEGKVYFEFNFERGRPETLVKIQEEINIRKFGGAVTNAFREAQNHEKLIPRTGKVEKKEMEENEPKENAEKYRHLRVVK